MKRLIAILLTALILTGCGQSQVPDNTVPPNETVSMYEPEQTGGTVTAYEMPNREITAIAPMGADVLLIEKSGQVALLDVQTGELTRSVQTGTDLAQDAAFAVYNAGMSYFQEDKSQVVLLDQKLREYDRVQLPGDISGHPSVSFGTGEVYYCQGQQVRAMDMHTEQTRLILAHRFQQAQLIGCHLAGQLLILQTVDAEGAEGVAYVDSATGRILAQLESEVPFYSDGMAYLARYADGQVQQNVFGKRGAASSNLLVEDQVYGALKQYGAVTCVPGESSVTLDFYDLAAGACTASVTVPELFQPVDVNASLEYVWVLGRNDGKMTLYRWNAKQNPVSGKAVCAEPWYNAQNPDAEGLAQCQARIDALNSAYGINIRIWEDAVAQSGGYELSVEYHPQEIDRMLDELEPVLACFPEEFLSKTIRGGKLQICLVRDIAGDLPYRQFFADGNAFVVLDTQADTAVDFLRAFGYVIDSHVLGNSRDYDNWAELNPFEFDYAYTYDWEPDEDTEVYMMSGIRYFLSSRAMTYPHEDRCSIFVQAMLPDSEELFREETMQRKLCRLCEGIREAYGLEGVEEPMPWEQYLTMEMNYSNR